MQASRRAAPLPGKTPLRRGFVFVMVEIESAGTYIGEPSSMAYLTARRLNQCPGLSVRAVSGNAARSCRAIPTIGGCAPTDLLAPTYNKLVETAYEKPRRSGVGKEFEIASISEEGRQHR